MSETKLIPFSNEKREIALKAFYDEATKQSAFALQALIGHSKFAVLLSSEILFIVQHPTTGIKNIGATHFHQILSLLKEYSLLSDRDIASLKVDVRDMVQSQFTVAVQSIFQQICQMDIPSSISTDDGEYESLSMNEVAESKKSGSSDEVKFLTNAIDQYLTDDVAKIWSELSCQRLRSLGECIQDLAILFQLCSHPLMKIGITTEYYQTLSTHWCFKNQIALDRQVAVCVFVHILKVHIKCLNESEAEQLLVPFQAEIQRLKQIELEAKLAKDKVKAKEEEHDRFLNKKESDLTVGERLALEREIHKIRADEQIRVKEYQGDKVWRKYKYMTVIDNRFL